MRELVRDPSSSVEELRVIVEGIADSRQWRTSRRELRYVEAK